MVSSLCVRVLSPRVIVFGKAPPSRFVPDPPFSFPLHHFPSWFKPPEKRKLLPSEFRFRQSFPGSISPSALTCGQVAGPRIYKECSAQAPAAQRRLLPLAALSSPFIHANLNKSRMLLYFAHYSGRTPHLVSEASSEHFPTEPLPFPFFFSL